MNSLRFIALLPLLLCLKFNLFAQQLPQYSQYMFNMYLINPAVAGTSDYFQLNIGTRYQWIGVEGAPRTFFATGYGFVGKEDKRLRGIHKNQNSWHHGLGFSLFADVSGGTDANHIFNSYRFNVTYAYDFKLTEKIRTSFGANIGMQQLFINAQGAEFNSGFSSIVFNSTRNFIAPDLATGVFVYHPLWYAGISAYNLLNNKIPNTPYSQPIADNNNVRHYFAATGGIIRLSRDPEIDMIPSILLKFSEGLPIKSLVSADFNLKFTYKELFWKEDYKIWAGFSYRSQSDFILMAGARYKSRFEFGYAFDFGVSQLRYNSHELMLGYRFIPKQKVLSPSDFWIY
jgi:type IX secretion system PorP/SprF family membrane protein